MVYIPNPQGGTLFVSVYAKGRMITKDISKSDSFASLSVESQVLFCMIIPHLNSHGKLNGDPHFIKGEVAPKVKWLNVKSIDKALREIAQKTNIKWFKKNGLYYLHSTSWKEHQKLDPTRIGLDELPSYSGVSQELVVHEVEVEVEDKVEAQVKGEVEEEVKSISPNGENSPNGQAGEKQNKPYVVDTDLKRVVVAWKLMTGFARDDRAWDKAHFARASAPAKKLLDFLGSWQDAADCIGEVGTRMEKAGMTFTLETILKHSADWKVKNGKT